MVSAASAGQEIKPQVKRLSDLFEPLFPQAYDMVYELNEVEARDELYPSTLSYLELLNALIAADPDAPDQGRRWVFEALSPYFEPPCGQFTDALSLQTVDVLFRILRFA